MACSRVTFTFTFTFPLYMYLVYEFGILVKAYIALYPGAVCDFIIRVVDFCTSCNLVYAVSCGDIVFTCVYFCSFTASVKLLPSFISSLTSRLHSLRTLCLVFSKWLIFNCYLAATEI